MKIKQDRGTESSKHPRLGYVGTWQMAGLAVAAPGEARRRGVVPKDLKAILEPYSRAQHG